jgi:hypothetical protein
MLSTQPVSLGWRGKINVSLVLFCTVDSKVYSLSILLPLCSGVQEHTRMWGMWYYLVTSM